MPKGPVPDQHHRNAVSSDPESDQPKPVRACQLCRASKVRCIQLDDTQPCVRCHKAGRVCLPNDTTTKRQKRSHSRSVADRDVTIALDVSRDSEHVSGTDGPVGPAREPTSSDRWLSPSTRISIFSPERSHIATAAWPPLNTYPLSLSGFDISSMSRIEATIAGIFDEATANAIFEEFRTHMLPEFPFVVFPQNVGARDMCRNNPVTFLAILDVAANGFCELQATRQLRKLLVTTYSGISPGTAEVTLPLLQAFLISACWNKAIYPSQLGEQIDVHQIIHASTSMAILMGLGRTMATNSWNGPMMSAESRWLRGPTSEYQECSLEARRIWLGCHYVSSNASMALQTPNIMRWTRYMDECLEVLETSPASVASDKVLCHHVRLQHILEDFELQLFASATGPTATELTHAAFRTRLATWAATPHTWTGSLRFSHQFVKLYMHEIVMYSAQTIDNPEASKSDIPTIDPNEFADCLAAAHGLLDVFLSLDMSNIRALPTIYCVRVIYVAVALVKLHFASARLPNPADAAERILSLKVDDYLGRILQKLGGWGTLWPSWRLIKVLQRIRELFQRNQMQSIQGSELSWLNSWAVGESPSVVDSPQETNIQWTNGSVFLGCKSTTSQEESVKAGNAAPTRQDPSVDETTCHDETLGSMDMGTTLLWDPDLIDNNVLTQWLEIDMETSAVDFERDLITSKRA